MPTYLCGSPRYCVASCARPGILNTADGSSGKVNTRQSVTRPLGSIGPETAGLDVCRLEVVAKELCNASLASSSSKTYKSAQNIFITSYGRTPLPASGKYTDLVCGLFSGESLPRNGPDVPGGNSSHAHLAWLW